MRTACTVAVSVRLQTLVACGNLGVRLPWIVVGCPAFSPGVALARTHRLLVVLW